MQKIDLTQLGGLFTYQDTLDFIQTAHSMPIKAIAAFIGEKYVISGCVQAGNVVSDGWIVVDGEPMQFFGGTVAVNSKIIITTVVTDEAFDDGTLKPIYETKTASLGLIGGFDYTELKRLPFNTTSINDAVTQLSKIAKAIIQFEQEVILEGCAVTNVNIGTTTLDISAGLVMFDGKLLNAAAYTGAYPCYLKEDGGWATVEPVTGLYITFDPYTSQRYKNVLDRAITPIGRIVLEETLTDRFDVGTGLGKWEMKGYQLMNSLQSRVPVGLWYDGVAVANVTDANHSTAGNVGGEKEHQLTIAEMPSHTHGGITKLTGTEQPLDYDSAGGGDFLQNQQTDSQGGDQSHNNLQPYKVVVYAKRI